MDYFDRIFVSKEKRKYGLYHLDQREFLNHSHSFCKHALRDSVEVTFKRL